MTIQTVRSTSQKPMVNKKLAPETNDEKRHIDVNDDKAPAKKWNIECIEKYWHKWFRVPFTYSWTFSPQA